MAGTAAGAAKARAKILARDPGFFQRIGSTGGKNGTTGGFYWMKEHDPEKFLEVSAKGGFISKRRKKVDTE